MIKHPLTTAFFIAALCCNTGMFGSQRNRRRSGTTQVTNAIAEIVAAGIVLCGGLYAGILAQSLIGSQQNRVSPVAAPAQPHPASQSPRPTINWLSENQFLPTAFKRGKTTQC